MAIPTHLKHKPLYGIEDYSKIDGIHRNHSDVEGISLGKAQWCDSGSFVPSVKVWRKPNGRWSRQSEETTITRALDMATLVIKVLNYYRGGADMSICCSVFGNLKVEKIDKNPELLYELEKYLEENKGDIQEHLKLLEEAINQYENKNNPTGSAV